MALAVNIYFSQTEVTHIPRASQHTPLRCSTNSKRMDAHAHLISLGWAGPGHSLDSRPRVPHKGRRGLAYDPSANANTGRGLVKPLLISQKKNSFGIGKKVHEPAAGNEWWLKGFEDALSNIGKGGSNTTSGTATPDQPSYRGKHTGLYGYFVKGQQIKGTMDGQSAPQSVGGKKRKSDTLDGQSSERSSPEPPSQKKSKSKRVAKTEFEQIGQFMEVMERDRRKPQKSARVGATEEFAQVGSFLAVGKTTSQETPSTNPDVPESKEERRRRRKAEKQQKVAQEGHLEQPMSDAATDPKAARKAERKKRKEEKRLAADMT